MRAMLVMILSVTPLAALGGEVAIDDFEGPVVWKPFPGGGPPVEMQRDTEHVASGQAALRLKYTAAEPFWSNLRRPVSVPPDAVAVAMSLVVHSAQPRSAMHFWFFEPDKDGWLAQVCADGVSLDDLSEGWHEMVVPIAAFKFQPRGPGTRRMVSADRMLIGCNYADLDVTIDRLRFITSDAAGEAALATTADLQPEEGTAGRAAILADDLPGGAGAASPEKIAAMVRKLDYGATLLKSGDVADAAIFNRQRFDVLIVPCAPSYPRAGHQALLGFLKQGGSLVSIGGYAFDQLMMKTDDGWTTADLSLTARDMNRPGPKPRSINIRFGTPGDTMRLRPDQVGAFDPSYLLEHVAYAEAAPEQTLLSGSLRIAGPLEGYAASAMTGSNSPVFPDIYARWIPILNGYDSLGRLRGAVMSVVHHWRGPFAGSSWALLGVTNRDLISGDAAGDALLAGALRAVTEPVFLHGLQTDLACYRQGEKVQARVEVTNHGRRTRDLVVRYRADGLDPVEAQVSVAAGMTESVEVLLHDGPLERDFYTVTAELLDPQAESAVDRMGTALVVWNEELIKRGPKIDLVDNYFTFDGVPRFFCGSNQTGMMWYSEDENPLVWERDFGKMQACGMRMLRVLHFSPFAAEDPLQFRQLGVGVLKGRPKRLLRQTDAIVQIAQKHGVVIFLTLHDWMPVELSDEELDLQRQWARFWADRYRHVPGIIYDVQNEPGWRNLKEFRSDDWQDVACFRANLARTEKLNRWIKANVQGVKEGDPDALVTVGFLRMMEPADKLLGTAHTDFSNMHYHSEVAGFTAEFKLIDRRFVGKTFSLGEFGARESHDARTHGLDGTKPDESIERFLTLTHQAFGMGASFALNWDWKDFDGCIFPWGLNHAPDLVDKRLLSAYRNMSLFLERFRPRYEDPGLYLLAPDSHRLGPRGWEVHAAILRAVSGLMANHVNFNVVNEFDLERLPASCRTLVWPVPYCPDDATFQRVLGFVRAGGNLYLSGDVAYDPTRERTRAGRLAELGLKDPGGRPPFAKISEEPPGEIQRKRVGQGRVFFVPTPVELEDGPVVETLREFLDFAGEKRIHVEPDEAQLYVFTVPLVDGGATVISNRTETDQDVRLAESELRVAKNFTGLIATNDQGKVTAVECTGRSASGGRPITSGDAHVMLAGLDGRDVRQSDRLAIFPITPGTLTVHTQHKWQTPVLEAGEFEGANWKTLAKTPLEVRSGRLTIRIDEDLARSILVLREETARSGL